MKDTTNCILEELYERYPMLKDSNADIVKAFEILVESAREDKTIFTCGNGGSAADAEHIVGELLKSFKKKRPIDKSIKERLCSFGMEGAEIADTLEGAVSSVALTSHVSLSTAFANDRNPTAVFAQQLFGLGKTGDSIIAISTSGNSKNCVYALLVAKAKGIKTVSFTGMKESKMSALSDVTIRVPETETFKVQELHLPVYHALCAMIENEMF